MKEKKKLSFSAIVLLALALGIVTGIALQGAPDIATKWIKPFGTLYLNAIKMIIVPLVFCSIAVGACELGDIKKFGRIGGKTMAFFMVTTTLAITIGVVLANVTNVGAGLNLASDVEVTAAEAPSIIDTIVNIVPSNPFAALGEGNTLQIIFFALVFGAGITMLGEKAKPVETLLRSLNDLMLTITNAIMKFTPIGVFALICPVLATNGLDVLLPLLSFVLVVYAGFACHILLVYFPAIRFMVKDKPLAFIKKIWEPIVFSFSTCSSNATLPYTLQAGKELGVSRPIRSFVLPLGATVNMDGSALYQGVTAIFVAHLFGIDLSLTQQLTIILTAVLASIGTAGVAGASIIMISVVLSSVGMPLEGVAIVAGVDKLIDMPRTSMNIIGDLATAAWVARTEGELDPEKTALED